MSFDLTTYMPDIFTWANSIIKLLMPVMAISMGFGLGMFILRKITGLFGGLKQEELLAVGGDVVLIEVEGPVVRSLKEHFRRAGFERRSRGLDVN